MADYGYARVSTKRQRIERQILNIQRVCPEAIIFQDKYTGTSHDRPDWNRLMKKVKKGDTIRFDEVSRMSRNAEEGFKEYQRLYEMGVDLYFLKEPMINTEVYRKALQNVIKMTGTDVDVILEGINKFLMLTAKRQIELAFERSQKEVDYLHIRTKEGVRRAQAAGKIVGRPTGSKIITTKFKDSKKKIQELSKSFDGTLSDRKVMEYTGLSHNTYYRYKSIIKTERKEKTHA